MVGWTSRDARSRDRSRAMSGASRALGGVSCGAVMEGVYVEYGELRAGHVLGVRVCGC